METSTSSALINNFATTVILNFNLQVFINLLFYSAAVTAGVLAASKIITFLLEEFISAARYKWAARYERRSEEIHELNKKMHDRLVEITDAIDSGKADHKAIEARRRLLYNASRLKKYDETIFDNVDDLINNVSFKDDGKVIIKNISQTKVLINKIRTKVDKLWFGIG